MTSYFPTDWPPAGPIDLAIHDLPHASSSIEWWYVNTHITTTHGAAFSLFASFFRMVVGQDQTTGAWDYAHSVTWALVDVEGTRYYADSCIDPRSPAIGLERLAQSEGSGDKFIRRALRELLERGTVPHPDRLIAGPICVSQKALSLDFGGNCFYKDDAGCYHLTLCHAEARVGCELIFQPDKEPIRHGDDGVVRGVGGEDMFYYFMPSCQVTGVLVIDNQPLAIAQGSGWYDHEFGRNQDANKATDLTHEVAWNWLSLQLDNGYEVSAYDLFAQPGGQSCGRWAIVIDPDGQRHQYADFCLTPLDCWTSTRTFADYPTRWELQIPQVGLQLTVAAAFAAQEFITVIAAPSFWEGRMNAQGVMHGQAVTARGFLERSGFSSHELLPDFLNAVGEQTRRSVHRILPLDPTAEQALWLMAGDTRSHYLTGFDVEQYTQLVVQPLRDMIDRGGKAWRSYAGLVCIDIVGGNSQPFAHLLAVPELLHTGSLIIDDIQDRSTLRRGGATCHLVYGEPLAINAGTAAYFLWQNLIHTVDLSDRQKLQIYDLYFEAMRAAHAGQALDLQGLTALMPAAVESGDSRLLEERVLAIHRLKTAAPVRALAEMWAVVGQATPAQIKALGDFFEALGLAFQIMDDVLNLRGFENNFKTQGEDIAMGKITLPIAKAMAYLPCAERRLLWATLSTPNQDEGAITAMISLLEGHAVLRLCTQQAHDLVECAWQTLNPLVRDSQVKLMLRAFSWFVLERHY